MVDSENYLLTCTRYIELNPVRAGIVVDPADNPWSSFLCNALGHSNDWLELHAKYRKLGRNAQERQAFYRALFAKQLPEQAILEIRDAGNKAWKPRYDRFKQPIQEQLNRRVEPKARGGDRKSAHHKTNQPMSSETAKPT